MAYRPLTGTVPDVPGEDLERELIFAGIVGIIDPPRPEARAAVADAHRAGIRVVMITGDHPTTAARIAEHLGIAEAGARAMTGADLDKLRGGTTAPDAIGMCRSTPGWRRSTSSTSSTPSRPTATSSR